jgi:hypothetical protein
MSAFSPEIPVVVSAIAAAGTRVTITLEPSQLQELKSRRSRVDSRK